MPTNAIYHSDLGRRMEEMSNQLCERNKKKKKIKSTERFVVVVLQQPPFLDSGVLLAYTCQDL
jgi:hypothetical protein